MHVRINYRNGSERVIEVDGITEARWFIHMEGDAVLSWAVLSKE